MIRRTIVAIALVSAAAAMAFPTIPKESGKALAITRGKPFDSGIVFINGKYLKSPYVVERWGTGIRINKKQVTGQIVDWNEFVKTQSGAKATTITPAAEPAVTAEPAKSAENSDEAEEDDSESSLDDLFDDDPKPKKEKKRASAPRKTVVQTSAPVSEVSYSFDGTFQPNDASKKLLEKINKVRTDIDAQLRSGGVIFFGDAYSRISGGNEAANTVIESLPELLRNAESADGLFSEAQSAGLVYLTQQMCEELYRNRVDYLELQKRREKWRKDIAWKKLMNGDR